MANDIKVMNIINPQTIAKSTPSSRKESVLPASELNNDGTKLTSQLGSLVNTLLADNEIPDNSQRIAELKSQVQANQYRVDLDLLASKLAHTLTNTK